MSFVPRTKREVSAWLRQHKNDEPISLQEWKASTEMWSGWELRFHQLLVHDSVGSEIVTLRSNYRSASKEIDRHGGIRGDWAVRSEHALLLEATLILADGKVARLMLFKEGKMNIFFVNQKNGLQPEAEFISIAELPAYAEALGIEGEALTHLLELVSSSQEDEITIHLYPPTPRAPEVSTGYGEYYTWTRRGSFWMDDNIQEEHCQDEGGEWVTTYTLIIQLAPVGENTTGFWGEGEAK